MTWTRKYWEMLDQLYWVPSYISLKSINKNKWIKKNDLICIPKNLIAVSNTLYTRDEKIDDYLVRMKRLEEMFNNIFDFVFAILPGDAVADIWGRCMGEHYDLPFESYGKDIVERYSWKKFANITQPDGYFLSDDIVLGVELKFNAKTSLDQLIKYLYLMMLEEENKQKQLSLHFLYIFNKLPEECFLKQLGSSASEINNLNAKDMLSNFEHKEIAPYIHQNFELFENLLKRVVVRGIDYIEFVTHLTAFNCSQNDDLGGRTLKNLINGLITEINVHPLSNVNR